jgi:hypothetical protein
MHHSSRLVLSAILVLLLVAWGSAPAYSETVGPVIAGVVLEYEGGSPHPYPGGKGNQPKIWTETVTSPGAEFIRVHLANVDLQPRDVVGVGSPDGSQLYLYKGMGPFEDGDVWSFAIHGDTAIVGIWAGKKSGYGYDIDAIGHGTISLQQSSGASSMACGDDAREEVACHLPEVSASSSATARLLTIDQQGFQVLCTGWLVSGSTPNTLITANHCVSHPGEVRATQATFNHQFTTCLDGIQAPTTEFLGDQLLKTNNVWRNGEGNENGLDYTLMTLLGDPESTWGELTPTVDAPAIGDEIWIVQHPDGVQKKIAYYEDVIGGARCQIDMVDQTFGLSAYDSQMAYACDTSGGASGSAVVDALSGLVLGIHHFGNVATCYNAATEMPEICGDAGELLSCTCTSLLPNGASCTADSECCSGTCKKTKSRFTCQ